MTLNELFEAAKVLVDQYDSQMGWYSGEDSEGDPSWNHWSCGLEELRGSLGRRLTDAELCIFSLSLDYGPMPGIDAVTRARYSALLWPRGNHSGCAQHPLDVIARLAWAAKDTALECLAKEELGA